MTKSKGNVSLNFLSIGDEPVNYRNKTWMKYTRKTTLVWNDGRKKTMRLRYY